MQVKRTSEISRQTAETNIHLALVLDGKGESSIETGIGFFNHMLILMTKHGSFDLQLKAVGDIQVDCHHTVEDVGICLGKAVLEALGNRAGIHRYGQSLLPMDESLALVAVDVSGRGFLAMEASFPQPKVGDFDTEMVEEFFRAFAVQSGLTLHIRMLAGRNVHHMIEAIFKGVGRALQMAFALTGKDDIPSTKGILV